MFSGFVVFFSNEYYSACALDYSLARGVLSNLGGEDARGSCWTIIVCSVIQLCLVMQATPYFWGLFHNEVINGHLVDHCSNIKQHQFEFLGILCISSVLCAHAVCVL